ncbi:MAG: glutaredoxin family protein [Chromatiales bacterium]|jgi:glutaredoxin
MHNNKIGLIAGLLLYLIAGIAPAEIYKWVDEQGKRHFSDKKPVVGQAETVRLKVNTYSSVSFGKSTADVGRQVIMYSTGWCGYCKQARQYFSEHQIRYTDYDIENNPTARHAYNKLGAKGVPVILVGNRRMNGFSASGFEQIYQP